MKVQTPPGMRDFYPEDMRQQNWLFDHWRRVSRAAGFVEYEGPIFEFLELYEAKSGAGIVSELFSFDDRGGRRFAIRPEMTPTLARMVAARANALPRPIKWFSLGRMCRAERPQRGRLREFFQWNVDILGVDDVLADAEVIATAGAFLRAVGLTPADIVIKVSSRALASAVLASLGISAERAPEAFALIDRAEKLEPAEFRAQWTAALGDAVPPERAEAVLADTSLERCLELVRASAPDGGGVATQFESLWNAFAAFGVREFCEFDLRTVRGLAYYTGAVFEVRTRKLGLRALFGGGRYDNLTAVLGGAQVPGVGFGAGDVPMLECLRELGKLPQLDEQLDVFVVDAADGLFHDILDVVGRLRQAGLSVDFSYKRQAIGKQLKQAASRRARYAVILGDDWRAGRQLAVKNLASGTQQSLPVDRLLDTPREALAAVV